MFKLYIGLDEERMERDGLDVEEAWNEIDEMVVETDEITTISRGEYETYDNGIRNYLVMLLTDSAWFMKYVNKFLLSDSSRTDDVIEACREMGIKISYE